MLGESKPVDDPRFAIHDCPFDSRDESVRARPVWTSHGVLEDVLSVEVALTSGLSSTPP